MAYCLPHCLPYSMSLSGRQLATHTPIFNQLDKRDEEVTSKHGSVGLSDPWGPCHYVPTSTCSSKLVGCDFESGFEFLAESSCSASTLRVLSVLMREKSFMTLVCACPYSKLYCGHFRCESHGNTTLVGQY